MMICEKKLYYGCIPENDFKIFTNMGELRAHDYDYFKSFNLSPKFYRSILEGFPHLKTGKIDLQTGALY